MKQKIRHGKLFYYTLIPLSWEDRAEKDRAATQIERPTLFRSPLRVQFEGDCSDAVSELRARSIIKIVYQSSGTRNEIATATATDESSA